MYDEPDDEDEDTGDEEVDQNSVEDFSDAVDDAVYGTDE